MDKVLNDIGELYMLEKLIKNKYEEIKMINNAFSIRKGIKKPLDYDLGYESALEDILDLIQKVNIEQTVVYK